MLLINYEGWPINRYDILIVQWFEGLIWYTNQKIKVNEWEIWIWNIYNKCWNEWLTILKYWLEWICQYMIVLRNRYYWLYIVAA